MPASRRLSGDQESAFTRPVDRGQAVQPVRPGVPGADLAKVATSAGDPGPVRAPGHATWPSVRSGPFLVPVSGSQIRTEAILILRWRAAGRPGSSSGICPRSATRVSRLMVRSSRPLSLSQTLIVPSSPDGRKAFAIGPECDREDEMLVPSQLVSELAIWQADQ